MAIRKFVLAAVLAGEALLATACRGKHHRNAIVNEEPPETANRTASAFRMNDPAAGKQLLKGVYGVEAGAWRWASGHFSILLRPPLAAAQHGATLSLGITVPDVVVQKLGKVTLSVSSGGTKLKSESYSKTGAFTLSADVPPSLLTKDSVTFDFDLDKSIPAGTIDQRELGIIVSSVALESK